jgi:hypothetical protein
MLRNCGLVVGSAVVMPLLETNPPRRGGPQRPPAQDNVTVGFIAVMPDSPQVSDRLRGGCIPCVPRSPDVTQIPDDRLVRLG